MSLANEMQIDLINLGIRELVAGSAGITLDDDISNWEEQMFALLTEKMGLVAQVNADRDHLAEEIDNNWEDYKAPLSTVAKKKAKKK